MMVVLEYAVPVVATHRAIKMDAPLIAVIYQVIGVLVDKHVITVATIHVMVNVVVLVLLVVHLLVVIVLKRVRPVVLVPPSARVNFIMKINL